MQTCPRCAASAPGESRFCPSCGQALATAAAGDATQQQTTPVGAVSGSASAVDQGRFLPGTMLAQRYRIVGLLGRGGMGEVYRADDLKLGQPLALKFLPRGLERDDGLLQRFLGEVRTARQVTHPNVCRVYDIGDEGDQHFLSMEYVDGEDLASLQRRIGRLPEDKATQIARQICAGVQAAHEQGILHRDLKPANVMIDGRGQVKIMDFGLAALEDEIRGGEIRSGTPDYMAPEQLAGNEVTARSDIYALGLVLYELFTGERAFREGTGATRPPTSTPAPPSSHVAGMSPVVEQAILRCLDHDPANRPASALMVAAGLPGGDPLAAALAAGETPSPELVAEAGRRDGMQPLAATGLALAGVILFLAATYWAGTMTTLHFLPLGKRPEVLIDRAQGILAELGYEEDAYRTPVDQAWGMIQWRDVIDEVRDDPDGNGWEDLRNRPDAVSFWYRQSPRGLVPYPLENGPVFTRGQVALTNPPLATAGEASVALDLVGNLRRLEIQPKRMSTRELPEPDWGVLFRLAALDPERFEEVRPVYQRFHAPDSRRAWMGTREELPEVTLHVEVGAFEGRPTMFNVATPAGLENLAEDPEPKPLGVGERLGNSVEPLLILFVMGASVVLARRNLKQGRADRRGAARFAWFMAVAYMVADGLASHRMMSSAWPQEVWPLIAAGMFFGLAGWMIYLAAEPVGRRVWPRIFVSLNRLVSPASVVWRDPLIGQAVLVGVLFGAVRFALTGPIEALVLGSLDGTPRLLYYDFRYLVGESAAVAQVLGSFLGGLQSFFVVALIVVLRGVLRRSWAAVLGAVVLWPLMGGITEPAQYGVALLVGALSVFVLLRWGVMALLVMHVTSNLAWIARSTDLSAWYSRPALLAVLGVVALTLYGLWAALGAGRTHEAPAPR